MVFDSSGSNAQWLRHRIDLAKRKGARGKVVGGRRLVGFGMVVGDGFRWKGWKFFFFLKIGMLWIDGMRHVKIRMDFAVPKKSKLIFCERDAPLLSHKSRGPKAPSIGRFHDKVSPCLISPFSKFLDLFKQITHTAHLPSF